MNLNNNFKKHNINYLFVKYFNDIINISKIIDRITITITIIVSY